MASKRVEERRREFERSLGTLSAAERKYAKSRGANLDGPTYDPLTRFTEATGKSDSKSDGPLGSFGGLLGNALQSIAEAARITGAVGGLSGANVAPSLQEPTQDPLEALLASIPGVDRNAYVAPFDQAESAARSAYEAAVPSIESTYANLQQRLAGNQADFASEQQGVSQGLEQRIAQGLGDVRSTVAPSLADLMDQGGGGSLTAGVEAENAQQLANLKVQGGEERALTDRLAQVQSQSAQDRSSDAELAQSAALANASTNLESTLQQIGLGRADAERQFNLDSAQRAAQVADARAQYQAQQLEQMEKLATTPRDDFIGSWEERVQRNPLATAAFGEITGAVKGTGPMAMTQALQQIESGLQGGVDPVDGEEIPPGVWKLSDGRKFRLDRDVLAQWIRDYYDDQTRRISPQVLAYLGRAG